MSDEEMPPPCAVWMALGIVIWAIASAMSPSARGRFVQALDRLSGEHKARRRLVTFSPISPKTSDLSRGTRLAITWVRRIVDELRAARG